MVPDWERVVAPVIDAALARPDVDGDRVVLFGWSLGGYLALRAATGEHRLAACLADPGLASVRAGMVGLVTQLGLSGEAVTALPDLRCRSGHPDDRDRSERRPALEDRSARLLGERSRE
jgi:dienelactone hydrolase